MSTSIMATLTAFNNLAVLTHFLLPLLSTPSTALPLSSSSRLITRDYDDVDVPNGAAGQYSEGGYKPPDPRASLITVGVLGFLGIVGIGVFFFLWLRLRRYNQREEAELRVAQVESKDPRSPECRAHDDEDDEDRNVNRESPKRTCWRRVLHSMVPSRNPSPKAGPADSVSDSKGKGKGPAGITVSITPLGTNEVPRLGMPEPPARAVTIKRGEIGRVEGVERL